LASLYISSVNPIENVLTAFEEFDCMSATIVEESTPPDKNAPNGTSEIICNLTALLSKESNSVTASFKFPLNGFKTPSFATFSADQYLIILPSTDESETINNVPGSNL
jgi:hypothetical protein